MVRDFEGLILIKMDGMSFSADCLWINNMNL